MPKIQETDTTLVLRNKDARGDIILGIILILLGIVSLASISYLFHHATLTCRHAGDGVIDCTIEQFRLSGTETRDVQDVQSVYIAEIDTAGTGGFQVVRDQIVLIATEEDVAVPYFYSADFGRVQTLETRIRNYINEPRGFLVLRESHQVEHEFLNVIAGVVLMALGAAQIAFQVTHWTFERQEDGSFLVTKHRILGSHMLKEAPAKVRIARSTDQQATQRRGEKRRSWINLYLASGQPVRITHKYTDDEREVDTLEATTTRLRKFLGV